MKDNFTETVIPTESFIVYGVCDNCGGRLVRLPLAAILTSNPAQYPHKCETCAQEKLITGKAYPYTEYSEKGSGTKR
jgi:hypothetical protein